MPVRLVCLPTPLQLFYHMVIWNSFDKLSAVPPQFLLLVLRQPLSCCRIPQFWQLSYPICYVLPFPRGKCLSRKYRIPVPKSGLFFLRQPVMFQILFCLLILSYQIHTGGHLLLLWDPVPIGEIPLSFFFRGISFFICLTEQLVLFLFCLKIQLGAYFLLLLLQIILFLCCPPLFFLKPFPLLLQMFQCAANHLTLFNQRLFLTDLFSLLIKQSRFSPGRHLIQPFLQSPIRLFVIFHVIGKIFQIPYLGIDAGSSICLTVHLCKKNGTGK